MLVGPRPGPVQHWRSEMEACRAGSEEITLDAVQWKWHSLCLGSGVLWNRSRAGEAGAIPGLGGDGMAQQY